MPHTDTRSVKETYWYTTAQIDDLGKHWARQAANRVFLCDEAETPNRTALTREAVERLGAPPRQILLPLNKGNSHWTTVTVNIVQNGDKKDVQISFMDSLNASEIKRQSAAVQTEIQRIERLFRDHYRPCNVSSATYPHAWSQADGASCGPYSIANGIRCLAGVGAQANPGRKAIREAQLDRMTNGTAIRGCSTNNIIDNILIDWLFHQVETGQAIEVRNEDDVLNICLYYSEAHGADLAETINKFHDEYLPDNPNPYFRPYPVNLRIRELVAQYDLSPKGFSKKKRTSPSFGKSDYSDLPLEEILKLIDKSLPEPTKPKTQPRKPAGRTTSSPSDYSNLSTEELWKIIQAQESQKASLKPIITSIKQDNLAKKIDTMRQYMEATNMDQDEMYFMMQNIVQAIQHNQFDQAIEWIDSDCLKAMSGENKHACYQIISDVIGAKSISPSSESKLISLSQAYAGLSHSYKIIKGQALDSVREILDAEVTLLESAIDRGQASTIRQVGYLIQDFCSALANWVSGKGFESNYAKRMSVVHQSLLQTNDQASKKDYQSVLWAINTVKDAPEKITQSLQDVLNDTEDDPALSSPPSSFY